MYSISNDILKVNIAAKGAELQSIFNTATQLDYLWNGDPAFWSKHSPVLFPIVGGLKNNSYHFNGKTYPLGRHGFARDKDFSVKEQSANSIQFVLEDDLQTLEVYPFYFRFAVTYTLENNSIHISYRVENTGNAMMYFSVGGHPAFKVPLTDDTFFTGYYLQFNEPETAARWPLSADGLIETKPVAVLENTNLLPLTKELFFGDALVFKHLRSDKISIRNHTNDHGIEVSFTDFPYCGIWSAKNADFVCIEPWCGIADGVNTSGDLVSKEGIHALAPDELFERSWNIRLF